MAGVSLQSGDLEDQPHDQKQDLDLLPQEQHDSAIWMNVVSKGGEVVVKTAISMPFSAAQLSRWLIPNCFISDGCISQVQWSIWQGRKGWGSLTILDILLDWDKGLLCCRDASGRDITPFRICPLRVLYLPVIRTLWRYGGASALSKEVLYYCKVVYAVHRRVKGLSRRKGDEEQHQPMTLEAAIQDLQQLYDAYLMASPASAEFSTLKKLPDLLLCKGHADEWTPTQYEQEVLQGGLEIFLSESCTW